MNLIVHSFLAFIHLIMGMVGAILIFLAFEPRQPNRNHEFLYNLWYSAEANRAKSVDRVRLLLSRCSDFAEDALQKVFGASIISFQAFGASMLLSLASALLFSPFIQGLTKVLLGLFCAIFAFWLGPILIRSGRYLSATCLYLIFSSVAIAYFGFYFRNLLRAVGVGDLQTYLLRTFIYVVIFGVFCDLLVLSSNRYVFRMISNSRSLLISVICLTANAGFIYVLVEPMFVMTRSGLGTSVGLSPIRWLAHWFVYSNLNTGYNGIAYGLIAFFSEFSNVFTAIACSACIAVVLTSLGYRACWPILTWVFSVGADWKIESDRKVQFSLGTFLLISGYPHLLEEIARWLGFAH